jgi:S1-C subfamily serine protease
MKRFAVALLFGLCAYAGGLSAVVLTGSGSGFVWARQGSEKSEDVATRFEAVAKKVSPAVVALEAVKPTVKDGKQRNVDDSGSGVLVHLPGKDGKKGTYVLTNYHVVGQAPIDKITINLSDSRILRPTRVWSDPESDVAVLGVDGDDLPVATLGDSSKMNVGNWVLAFGSPFGLNQTVTHGIISARERGQVSLGSTIRIKDFLQTDASINPGSSGGPLVNMDGEIIGINTAIASTTNSNTGVAFSIPVNLVKKVSAQLLEKGRVTRGYLGVQLSPGFESTDATKLGLTRAQGALVDGVHAETPAASAGLRRNDVILELDGVAVRNENTFINAISAMEPGKQITLKVWRDRKAITIKAVVGDWSKAEARFKKQ